MPWFGQAVQLAECPAAPDIKPAMIFLLGLRISVGRIFPILGSAYLEEYCNRFRQFGLVVFDRQHVIRFFFADGSGNVAVGALRETNIKAIRVFSATALPILSPVS